MSARANPTTIGVFVIGAVALAIVVVLVFGSGTMFSKKERYVIFFSDSVNGLSVGAPVQMRGVKIGEVKSIRALFDETRPDRVVHLAAQAGVRYSIENPHAYVDANVVGFMNILEGARQVDLEHLVYASTSSVYGLNTNMPFSVHDNVDHPVSLYAATKKSNELMAHTYSHLFGLPTTGLESLPRVLFRTGRGIE